LQYQHRWFQWDEKSKSVMSIKILDSSTRVSLKDSLALSGNYVKDFLYNKPVDFFFSGGIQSQLILNSLILSNINFTPIFVKFKDNINYEDYFFANKICNDQQIQLKIIDFDLEKFFNNEAGELSKTYNCYDFTKLLSIKFSTLSDNICIVGNREPILVKNTEFIDTNAEWFFQMTETDMLLPSLESSNLLSDFLWYSPAFFKFFMKNEETENLIRNKLSYHIKSSMMIRNKLYNSSEILMNFRKKSPTIPLDKNMLYPPYVQNIFNNISITTPHIIKLAYNDLVKNNNQS
jgi:hypothetical protein